MIEDEQFNDLSLGDVPKKYFEEFSSNKQSLSEDEFYQALNGYLVRQTGSDEWTVNLKNENYFGVHMKKGEDSMNLDTFSQTLGEVSILAKEGNNGEDLEIDFSL
jgi:hypothetical protein